MSAISTGRSMLQNIEQVMLGEQAALYCEPFTEHAVGGAGCNSRAIVGCSMIKKGDEVLAEVE
jgi:hypothetical protein